LNKEAYIYSIIYIAIRNCIYLSLYLLHQRSSEGAAFNVSSFWFFFQKERIRARAKFETLKINFFIKHQLMDILFLDQAANTGYCIYDESKQRIVEVGNWKLTPKHEELSLYRHMEKIINEDGIGRIVAEEIYDNPDKKRAFKKLAAYRGMINMASSAYSLQAPYYMENIRAKEEFFSIIGHKAKERALAIKGIEGKEKVMRKVKGYGYTPETFDEADSIMIAIAYLRKVGSPLIHPDNTKENFPFKL
jgi:hypothetical protein